MKPRISILAAALLCVASGHAHAYPTSLNFIPTAETVGANTLLLEATNYGYSAFMSTESTVGVLSQIGLGNRLEFGADKYEAEDYSETYWNGKFQLFSESSPAPALAVGVMDIARTSKPTVYFAASKAIGSIRTHAGVIDGSYTHGIMAGVDLDIGERLWFAVDYLPGECNHLRVGLAHKLGSDSWLQISAGVPNDRTMASTELGFTFSSYINLVER